jgi:predicted anti-sigma-YlaC factor YlaD
MDCQTAQEQILESLTAAPPGTPGSDLEIHLAGCDGCRSFAEIHFMLDLQLSAAMSPPSLSPAFRSSLAKRLRREPLSVWSDFLPVVAHVVGCFFATGLCVFLLPFAAGSIMLAGLAFTIATYFLQTVLQSSLEAWEEGRQ